MRKTWHERLEAKTRSKRKKISLGKKYTKILLSKREILDTGCWIWTGNRHRNYGIIYMPEIGRNIGVHVLSLIIFDPERYNSGMGTQVNHKCNVKSCFNPRHLYKGTQRDNMYDYRLSLWLKRGKQNDD